MTKTAEYSPEALGLIGSERLVDTLFETEKLGLGDRLAEVLPVTETNISFSSK